MVKHRNALTGIVIALTLFALIASVSQVAAAGSSTLTVEVRNKYTNTPISGASVTITGPESHTAITGADGTVTFGSIASGSYSLVATAPDNHTAAPYNVNVNGDTRAIVLFGFTTAHFFYSPGHPLVNGTVFFNATLSSSSGAITNYDWDFGDGATGRGVTPTHVYTKADSYTVQLTVTSTVGTATYTQLVQVVAPAENGPFPWILLLLPLLFLIPLILFWRRRRYYVVIQARVPIYPTHPHCPGDNTKCEDCKLTPC
jgi:PKD repeat protein